MSCPCILYVNICYIIIVVVGGGCSGCSGSSSGHGGVFVVVAASVDAVVFNNNNNNNDDDDDDDDDDDYYYDDSDNTTFLKCYPGCLSIKHNKKPTKKNTPQKHVHKFVRKVIALPFIPAQQSMFFRIESLVPPNGEMYQMVNHVYQP